MKIAIHIPFPVPEHVVRPYHFHGQVGHLSFREESRCMDADPPLDNCPPIPCPQMGILLSLLPWQACSLDAQMHRFQGLCRFHDHLDHCRVDWILGFLVLGARPDRFRPFQQCESTWFAGQPGSWPSEFFPWIRQAVFLLTPKSLDSCNAGDAFLVFQHQPEGQKTMSAGVGGCGGKRVLTVTLNEVWQV